MLLQESDEIGNILGFDDFTPMAGVLYVTTAFKKFHDFFVEPGNVVSQDKGPIEGGD